MNAVHYTMGRWFHALEGLDVEDKELRILHKKLTYWIVEHQKSYYEPWIEGFPDGDPDKAAYRVVPTPFVTRDSVPVELLFDNTLDEYYSFYGLYELFYVIRCLDSRGTVVVMDDNTDGLSTVRILEDYIIIDIMTSGDLCTKHYEITYNQCGLQSISFCTTADARRSETDVSGWPCPLEPEKKAELVEILKRNVEFTET